VLNKLLLLLVTVKLSDWLEGSPEPLLKLLAHPLTVWAPASSFTDWSLPFVNDGSSFTAVTVTTNASSTVLLFDVPRTVIVAVPY